MDVVRVFPETLNAFRTARCGGKMDVGEFRDCMAEAVIRLPERAVAAVHMGYDPMGEMRSGRGGKGFDAVAHDKHDVGPQALKDFGELGKCEAGIGGVDRWGTAGLRGPGNNRVNSETVSAYIG